MKLPFLHGVLVFLGVLLTAQIVAEIQNPSNLAVLNLIIISILIFSIVSHIRIGSIGVERILAILIITLIFILTLLFLITFLI